MVVNQVRDLFVKKCECIQDGFTCFPDSHCLREDNFISGFTARGSQVMKVGHGSEFLRHVKKEGNFFYVCTNDKCGKLRVCDPH